MKFLFTITSLVASALSMDAEVAATLSRSAAGSVEIRLRNNSAKSLTAAAVRINRAGNGGSSGLSLQPEIVYFDTAMDTTSAPLAPNQDRPFPAHLLARGPRPLSLDALSRGRANLRLDGIDFSEYTVTAAAVFADGSTDGDPALLTRLLLRRSNMLLAVETTLEILSDVGSRNVPRDQLIAEFKRLANSASRGYLLPEQRVGMDLYQSMVGKLMNLPDLRDGSPFPPSEFVARETAPLRLQRSALSESQPSLFEGMDTRP